jgi:hypothetical protein
MIPKIPFILPMYDFLSLSERAITSNKPQRDAQSSFGFAESYGKPIAQHQYNA